MAEEAKKKLIREEIKGYKRTLMFATEEGQKKYAGELLQRFSNVPPDRLREHLSLLSGAVKVATEKGIEDCIEGIVDDIYISIK